jgi:hypothetical protein
MSDGLGGDDELVGTPAKELTPLQIFFYKVGIVTAAVAVLLYASGYFLEAFIARQSEQLAMLKGGPAFWSMMEYKLYRLADAPDMPPEQKKKIVDALHRLSVKYKPFVDALAGDASADAKSR